MPNNWEDLIRAGLAEKVQDAPNALVFIHGHLIAGQRPRRDISKYKIAFGLGPDDIVVRGNAVFDKNGKNLAIIINPQVHWTCKGMLDRTNLSLAKRMKEAASKPVREEKASGKAIDQADDNDQQP